MDMISVLTWVPQKAEAETKWMGSHLPWRTKPGEKEWKEGEWGREGGRANVRVLIELAITLYQA